MISYFQKDKWLTSQLSKTSFRLSFHDLNINQLKKNWKILKKKNDNKFFVYAKIDPNRIELIHFLEEENFRLIDTNIQFLLEMNTNFFQKKQKSIKIIFAEEKYKKNISKIAKNNFKFSRFHLDPKISNSNANSIKSKWVENYFQGLRGDEMIIALLDGNVVGFLQLIIKKEIIIIDLIGVDKKSQGKGVATEMIKFAHENNENKSIKVGTQISNVPSLRLYQNIGFVFSSSNYIFHYHSN